MKDINHLIETYYNWLKDNTFWKKDTDTGWIQISTPFFGLFNDPIEIFLKYQDDKILLSDDGLTLHNLELIGVSFNRSPKRREILEKILLTYGLKIKNNEIITEANEDNFPQKKHNFVSAISEINDMFMLSKPTVETVFKEDVKNYLDDLNLIYTPEFITRGRTGLEFTFDFQIAHRNKEIVIKTFNRLRKDHLIHFLFAWSDVKPVRSQLTNKKIVAIAMINDIETELKPELLNAIQSQEADYILWSERNKDQNKAKLIA